MTSGESLVRSESFAEGEEKDVTVLFADVRGFTGLAERHRPADVLRLLNRCFAVLVGCVRTEGGVVDKFLGDGLMAVFGAPLSQEDHAEHALRTAQAMQRAIQALVPELEAEGWESIGLGVGLESGLVVAGDLGTPERRDYTVVGDVVNVASRLTAGAGPGEVVLGAGAAAALVEKHDLIPLGPISIRGRRQPVVAYRLP